MTALHDALNDAQQEAVRHRGGPLLVLAGAGSGKTMTLAHRVADLIVGGADPRRILLLTFTRRAAEEMARRAQGVVARARPGLAAGLVWAGTFHAVGSRLLRLHAAEVGLDPSFTVLDRGDAADLLDVVRHDLDLSSEPRRFPQKSTCLSIYSRAVETGRPLAACLEEAFPWCREHEDALRRLFGAYVDAKQRQNVLDYDDLLLYWAHLMAEPQARARLAARFDHVLVDEYQDVNGLQAQILAGLKPDGRDLTVVGDDAQAIYGFRAADVRNIVEFPARFTPPARIVTLAQNYRSTQPLLDAANAVMAEAPVGFQKQLWSSRGSDERPRLVTVADEQAEADYVAARILAAREAGVPLKRQAVLFRAAHHATALELELSRRNVPFVKYGGLKFLEAAHVKDTLAILRLVENPRDEVAVFRVVQLLPGVGPGTARKATRHLAAHQHELAALAAFPAPPAARRDWAQLVALLDELRGASWPTDLGAVRRFYEPHLVRRYDQAETRAQDLAALEQLAAGYPSRERFLTELTLDAPLATGAESGPPHLDEDWLVLSTIHSAKGQEWDQVFVLHVVDGCIPSDMAGSTPGEPERIEEERRLLYVAMTRARDSLHLVQPLRFFVTHQRALGDAHVYAPRSRFLSPAVLERFTVASHGALPADVAGPPAAPPARIDVAARLRATWR